ncbi:MAG: PAS domain S-box protein, partial [Actinomycetota bacterium]
MTGEVRYRLRQQVAVAELGQRALVSTDLDRLMNEATALVAMGLNVELCKVLELLPDGKALLLKAGVGWKEGLVGNVTVGAGADSQAGYTLDTNEPVIVEDLRSEERFHGPPLLVEHEVVSGLSTIITGKERQYGVLGAHTRSKRVFTSDDVNFLVAVANILAAAVERTRMENELKDAEERYRSIIENAAEGFFQNAPDGRPLIINSAIARMAGFDSVEEAMANIDTVLSFYQDPSQREAFIGELYKKGEVKGYEMQARRRDGSLAWFSVNARLVRGSDGEPLYYEGFVEDVTERRKFEEELRDSEERYRTLVETSA